MARYIDADKKTEELNLRIESTKRLIENRPYDEEAKLILREHKFCLEELKDTPTADVVEVKHGEWKLTKTEFGWNGCEYPTEYTCTVCGGISPCCEESYCPNCGAKMDGKGAT